jgi:hypothetical protein
MYKEKKKKKMAEILSLQVIPSAFYGLVIMLKLLCRGVLLLYKMPVFSHPAFWLDENRLAEGDKTRYTLGMSPINFNCHLRSSFGVLSISTKNS